MHAVQHHTSGMRTQLQMYMGSHEGRATQLRACALMYFMLNSAFVKASESQCLYTHPPSVKGLARCWTRNGEYHLKLAAVRNPRRSRIA